MPIVDELLQEELTRAGVPEARQQKLLHLAQMGLLIGDKEAVDRMIPQRQMEAAWDFTGLPLPKRLEVLQAVQRKALHHLELIRRKQPWRS